MLNLIWYTKRIKYILQCFVSFFNYGFYNKWNFLYLWFCNFLQMQQILNIPFRSLNRTELKIKDFKPYLHCIINNFIDYFYMNIFISYNAMLSYLFTSCFKLWLDKTYYLSIICKKISYRSKYLGK